MEQIKFTLENADSFLDKFSEKYFDIVFDDPPYGIKEDGRKIRPHLAKQKNGRILRVRSGNHSPEGWDENTPTDLYFEKMKSKTKHYIVFGANYFPSISGMPSFKSPRRDKYEEFLKNNPTNWIIWDKVNGENDFSDCELIYTSLNIPSEIYYFMWAGMRQGKSIMEGCTMQGDKKKNEKRIHPTQKPVALYKYLLNKLCLPSQIIGDFHGGSMSIGIACLDYGFNLIACENNSTIFKKAKERLTVYKASNLFLSNG